VPTSVNLTTLVFTSFSIQPSSKKRSQTAAPRAPPRCGRELLEEGTYASITDGAIPYPEANRLFSGE
jgi:hypothetical protein